MLSQRQISSIAVAWTSDANGVASVQTDTAMSGVFLRAQFRTTSPAPSSYVATITDDGGEDMLNGQGTGFTSATSSRVPNVTLNNGGSISSVPPAVNSKLTVNISAAGSGKKGTVVLHFC